jgi:hypothetical protein
MFEEGTSIKFIGVEQARPRSIESNVPIWEELRTVSEKHIGVIINYNPDKKMYACRFLSSLRWEHFVKDMYDFELEAFL